MRQVHPYNIFIADKKLEGIRGWVRRFTANKDLIVQEVKRRDPSARPNKKNRTVDELMKLLKPITDPRDIAFVMEKEREIRRDMLNQLEDFERRKKSPVRKRRSADTENDNLGRPHRRQRMRPEEDPRRHLLSDGSLTRRSAERIVAAAERAALANGWRVCVALADADGNPTIVKRPRHAFPASFEIAVGKARAAAHCGGDAKRLGCALGDPRGATAVVVDGVCCGGIGVAGEASSKLEWVAKAGINALKDGPASFRVTDGSLELVADAEIDALENEDESVGETEITIFA